MPTLRHLTLTLLLGVLGMFPIAQANETTWQALQKGGLVILMRHSLAPGIGDSPGFVLEACETQRNLSSEGRAHALAAGQALRERGVVIDVVYSSQWCRALETAELMALEAVVPAPWLNSFFRGRGDQVAITQAARERIAGWQGPGNILLVTHQVNITALTGGGVSSGEMVVVRPQEEGFTVVGRLSVPSR
ncbi:histidine phosphatase family protein [Vreelandella lionensis]|uniref:histidine phosphatase family protein n=1 Tax=Halomonadaceae TaxID=28256 RepID=UPI0009F34BFE|nr:MULTISPECIES: histidine phosphatase family protein [Halomonas]MCP1317295.1 histidine phosphatase family protein [Halomonas sp. 707B3]